MSASPKRSIAIFLAAAVLVALALVRLGGSGAPEQVVRSRILMGTVVEITAWGEGRGKTEAAVTAAFDEMARIERLMGPGEESDPFRLSQPVPELDVSPETARVIALGLKVGEASAGAFDMTLGRLKTLWGIESETPRVPHPEEIAAALAGTGPGALRLEESRVVKADPETVVDLGGIVKGYAVDRALKVLKEGGVSAASVNAGGDISLLGDRLGRPWRIGIRHPRDPAGLLVTLELQDEAVVTSGDYERFFEKGGERFHHLFDPRTGYPARGSQSATVVAGDALLADALSTAVFVLGPREGIALLERTPEAEGIIVGPDGTVFVTEGLKGKALWP